MPTKVCTECGVEKPLTDYSPNKGRSSRSKCKPCESARVAAYWKSLPKDEQYRRKRNNVLKPYNLTQKQFDGFMLVQGNACAICNKPFESLTQAHIDHNHTTGKVRGLLCENCNRGLGLFYDNEYNLKTALLYLQNDGIM